MFCAINRGLLAGWDRERVTPRIEDIPNDNIQELLRRAPSIHACATLLYMILFACFVLHIYIYIYIYLHYHGKLQLALYICNIVLPFCPYIQVSNGYIQDYAHVMHIYL